MAGVSREDLFADDETRRPMTFHDLRHTGCTWRAIRGDGAFDIKDGAGHSDLETTQRYVNEGRAFGDSFGQVFPALPLGLLGESSRNRPGALQVHEITASPGGFEPPLAT